MSGFFYLLGVFYGILLFLIPVFNIGLFCVSLYRYVYAKRKNREAAGTFSPAEMKKRKLLLIVSSVSAGVLAVIVIGLIILVSMSIAFM